MPVTLGTAAFALCVQPCDLQGLQIVPGTEVILASELIQEGSL